MNYSRVFLEIFPLSYKENIISRCWILCFELRVSCRDPYLLIIDQTCRYATITMRVSVTCKRGRVLFGPSVYWCWVQILYIRTGSEST